MKRHHVIPIIILLVVLIGFGAVYQFYIKQQLQEYAENRDYRTALENRVKSLQTTFQGVDNQPVRPEEVIQQWREAAEPFREQITTQARFFTFGDIMEFNQVPENAIPKFFYMDERDRLENDLRTYALQRGTNITQMDLSFSVPGRDSVNRSDPPPEDVNKWLREYNFGSRMTRMLIDAGAVNIYGVVIWPPRRVKGLLQTRTVGLQFEATLDNLTSFMRSVMDQERFFEINAISINNSNLLSPQQPLLKVDMLLSQAVFVADATGQPGGGGGGAVAAPAGGGVTPLGPNADPGDILAQLRQKGGFGLRGDDEGEVDAKTQTSWYTPITRFFGF